MNKLLFVALSLSALSACKWTEFDDLRDETWVRAVSKPDGSKASNWGVGIVRSKATSASGGQIAIFGDNKARLNQLDLEPNGDTKFLSGDQDLAGLGIEQYPEPEPYVLANPTTDAQHVGDFAIVTQGTALQTVVAAGNNLSLVQYVVQGAGSVDGAAYMVPPPLDADNTMPFTPAKPQPIVASGNKLFGSNYDVSTPIPQPSCALTDGGTNMVNIRAVAGIRPTTSNMTDDVAVWTEGGVMLVLNGHVFNGGHSGLMGQPKVCQGAQIDDKDGSIDISTAPATTLLGTAVDTTFQPGAGTQAQILPFGDHFAVLQGHNQSGSFLALWDFTGGTAGTAGAMVGAPIAEPGLVTATLFQQDTKTFVVAGFPNAVIDGVATGKVEVFEVDTTTGIKATPIESLHDGQPDDGEAFGRGVATLEFNGKQIIAVAANNEVFFYYRTPTLYSTDARQ